MSEWPSIESAPKDGTTVDLWDPHWNERLVGYQRREPSPGNVYYEPAEGFGGRCVVRTASHWMPLPAPPEPAA